MIRLVSIIMLMALNISSAAASDQTYALTLQKLAKQIDDLQSKVIALEKSLREIKSKEHNTTDHHQQNITGAKGEVIEEPKASTSEEPNLFFSEHSNVAKDKKDYDIALAALKDSNFEEAEHLFETFSKNYPDSKLAENAMFWYAETFYRRELYNKAAIGFLQSYKRFPKGQKAADALLKLSFSLANLNKAKEACNMLDKLNEEFPERPINSIKKADEARTKFRCKPLS
jgi:tol-pal system protein YbgF